MFYCYLRRGTNEEAKFCALESHPFADEEVKDESLPRTRSTANG